MSTSAQTYTSPSAAQIPLTPKAHHIQFGATPHRTPTTTTTSRPNVSPAKDFDHFVPQKQMKSMSDLDKEEEARIAKTHREKAKKLGHSLHTWIKQMAKEKRGGGGGGGA